MAKAIFTGVLSEAAAVKKGTKVKFSDLKLREGALSDLAEMVRMEEEIKITVEPLQPGLFEDAEENDD